MELPHADVPRPEETEQGRVLWREVFAYRNQVRANLGLAPLPDDDWQGRYWSDRLILVASSARFSRPALDQWPQARLTGFWFDDPATAADAASAAVEEFLAGGEPPLLLTFSSLAVEDPAPIVALHAEAAARVGRRLIIQQGWANLGPEALPWSVDLANVCFTRYVPHAWLFPRVAAVIHHGGMGTTAQALRCGLPMLVEPYCNDQFFNARRIAALGVGAAADPWGLTPVDAATLLEEVVLADATRRRAREMAGRLAGEDGLSVACTLIEQQLSYGPGGSDIGVTAGAARER